MNIHKIREDFPILSRTVYGKPLVYLDNGATTQKPRLVIDSIVDEYYSVNANVHRGVHFLSQQATELHEASRETVRQFINARSTREVIFTRGTTEIMAPPEALGFGRTKGQLFSLISPPLLASWTYLMGIALSSSYF